MNLRFLFSLRDVSGIKHISCGKRLYFESWISRFQCPCGASWAMDTVARFSDQDLTDRFEWVRRYTAETGERLVWVREGKKEFLAVRPGWFTGGDPSGL